MCQIQRQFYVFIIVFSIKIYRCFLYSDAQDGSAMLMMTALAERSASERDARQKETEGKYFDISILLF